MGDVLGQGVLSELYGVVMFAQVSYRHTAFENGSKCGLVLIALQLIDALSSVRSLTRPDAASLLANFGVSEMRASPSLLSDLK